MVIWHRFRARYAIGWLLLIGIIAAASGCKPPARFKQKSAVNQAGPVTLRMMYWGSVEERDITNRAISLFTKQHPEIVIRAEQINGGDYNSKLTVQLAAGQAPDIIFVERNYANPLIRNGALLDLTSYVGAEPNFPRQDFRPQIWHAFEDTNGRIYAIPRDMGALVLYYNVRLFREAGVPPPPGSWHDDTWTWDKFLDTARKLTRDTNHDGRIDQFGVVMNRWTDMWSPWVYQNGGLIMSPDGTKCVMNTPATVEALQFITDLANQYKVAPNPLQEGVMGNTTNQLFEMNRAAMFPTGFWMVSEFSRVRNLEWDIAPLPYRKERSTTWHGSAFAIWSKSQHPKEAWEFLKFCASDEIQQIMAQSGLLIPARKSMAELPALLDMKIMPPHVRVFMEAFQYARAADIISDSIEINDLVNRYLDDIWNGRRPVPQVCDQITRRVNAEIGKLATKTAAQAMAVDAATTQAPR